MEGISVKFIPFFVFTGWFLIFLIFFEVKCMVFMLLLVFLFDFWFVIVFILGYCVFCFNFLNKKLVFYKFFILLRHKNYEICLYIRKSHFCHSY